MKNKSRISKLNDQYRMHLFAANAAESIPTFAQWHKAKAEQLRQQMLELYNKLDKNQPSAAVIRARDARWRHFGAIGQMRMALIAVQHIKQLKSATKAAQGVAGDVEDLIEKLLELLTVRKDPEQ